jgi:predicted ATPase
MLLLEKLESSTNMSSELYLLCDLFEGTTRSTLVDICGEASGKRIADQIIQLQLQAGRLSLQGSASKSAFIFFSRGLQLLSESDCWMDGNRETTLALYVGASQASYLIGDHKTTAKYYDIVSRRNDVALREKKEIINAYIFSLGAQNLSTNTTKEILTVLEMVSDYHSFPCVLSCPVLAFTSFCN